MLSKMGFGRAERIFHLGGNFGNSSSSGCKSGSRFCFLAGKLEMRPRVALLGSQSRHNKTIKSEIHPTLWSVSSRMYIWFGFHFKGRSISINDTATSKAGDTAVGRTKPEEQHSAI